MKKQKKFDVIVIGAGSGGLNIASFMNSTGFSVLLIDKSDRSIGGDCLNTGCVPSKALIHIAKLVRASKETRRFGQTIAGAIDIKKVLDYVREKQDHIREHENAEHFRTKGMTVMLGEASFVSADTVEVDGSLYTGRNIVIATGSQPRKLTVVGIEHARVYTNETIFTLEALPERMVVVGAGPIGVELGQALSVLGSKVTIVGSKLLDKEDPEMVIPLKQQLVKDGIELLLGYRPTEIIDGKRMIVTNEQGEAREVEFDSILSSIGRELSVESLHVHNAGIQTDKRGRLIVDQYLRTTNKHVFVCGDVAGGHQFTHAAEVHASLIISNFFSPLRKKLNTDLMAWVTYTSPEIATFGLQETELKKRKITYDTLTQDFASSDRAIVDEHTEGKLKVLVSKNGRVLGGTMVAENAGEIAQELMLAQATGVSLRSFMKKVYPYPTATRVNRTLVLSYLSRKLTKNVVRMLHLLYR